MKKNSCNCSQNKNGTSWHHCSDCSETKQAPGSDSNLYAAEFFLYAFHFEKEHRKTESAFSFANSLMILATEG